MSAIGQVGAGIAANYDTTGVTKNEKSSKTSKTGNYGNTIGQPQLSEKAAKYYEELKRKNSDMDFVLVSNDEVDNAEQKAAKFANPNRTMVLIDAEKIEKMAEDEKYREKYEGIISNANTQLDQMKQSLGSAAGDVKTFGIKVNDDGTSSYFAVVDKSLASQKDRIEKKAQQKAQDAKEEKAKAAKEKLEKARSEKTSETKENEKTQLETVSASSVEELIKKIQASVYAGMSDNVKTEQEMQLGTQVDFRL